MGFKSRYRPISYKEKVQDVAVIALDAWGLHPLYPVKKLKPITAYILDKYAK